MQISASINSTKSGASANPLWMNKDITRELKNTQGHEQVTNFPVKVTMKY